MTRRILQLREGEYNHAGGVRLLVHRVESGDMLVTVQFGGKSWSWSFAPSGTFQGLTFECTEKGGDRPQCDLDVRKLQT